MSKHQVEANFKVFCSQYFKQLRQIFDLTILEQIHLIRCVEEYQQI